MTIQSPTAAQPLFIPLARTQDFGLPCRTKCYALAKNGLLALVKDGAGRTGITMTEARRFVASSRPIAEAIHKRISVASLEAWHGRPFSLEDWARAHPNRKTINDRD